MKKLTVLITALLVMTFTGERAEADLKDVINLRLGSDIPEYTLGGAMNNTPGQPWNVLQVAGGEILNDLTYANGVTPDTGTGVTVNYTMGGSYYTVASAITNVDHRPLFQGFLYNDTTSIGTFEFSGLAAGKYNIYVYSQVTSDKPSSLSLTSQTSVNSYSLSFSNNASEFTDFAQANGTGDHGNWAMQTVVVDSNFSSHDGYDYNLVMTIGAGSSINGIQIEAVPEPGSVVLLGLGGVFFIGFTRMRTKENTLIEV